MKKRTYSRYKRLIDPIIRFQVPFISNSLLRRIYDHDFFDHANLEKRQSSREVAEIIQNHFNFDSVLDIGCGMGLYLHELSKLDKEVFGCDSSVDGIALASSDIFVFYADVTKPIILNRAFDIVVCFEVAEHVQRRHSQQLVENCVRYGRTVLFTAAPKGQGGVGHINEQSPGFWIDLFQNVHFSFDEKHSSVVRDAMKNAGVVSWIANNLMIFQPSIHDPNFPG